jgi:hypothetical protein
MSITPLDVASKRPSKPTKASKPRKPFRTETTPEPSVFVVYGNAAEGGGERRPVIDGRAVGRFELADIRRREVLERDFKDAMRRRALHLRTGNQAAYRKADEQAEHYMHLIRVGRDQGRWES